MARHGENIRKRKDGRWEGRYLVYSEAKGRTIYRSVYGSSYEEIRKKLTAEKRPKGPEGGSGPGGSTGPEESAWSGGSTGLEGSMGFPYGNFNWAESAW